MKKFLIFLWWRFNPPVNVRVLYRAIQNPTYVAGFDRLMIETCLNKCTPLELAFVFRHAEISQQEIEEQRHAP